jgi:hypothetical protein
MSAALEWGLTPGAWYATGRDERAMMIATSIMKIRIQNIQAMTHGDK